MKIFGGLSLSPFWAKTHFNNGRNSLAKFLNNFGEIFCQRLFWDSPPSFFFWCAFSWSLSFLCGGVVGGLEPLFLVSLMWNSFYFSCCFCYSLFLGNLTRKSTSNCFPFFQNHKFFTPELVYCYRRSFVEGLYSVTCLLLINFVVLKNRWAFGCVLASVRVRKCLFSCLCFLIPVLVPTTKPQNEFYPWNSHSPWFFFEEQSWCCWQFSFGNCWNFVSCDARTLFFELVFEFCSTASQTDHFVHLWFFFAPSTFLTSSSPFFPLVVWLTFVV